MNPRKDVTVLAADFPQRQTSATFFQMQIGLLAVAVRLLREEFKRKGNTPLGLIREVWVTLIK